jgi:hypothetical protein
MLGCEEKHVAGGRIGGPGKGGVRWARLLRVLGVLCVSFVRRRESARRNRGH